MNVTTRWLASALTPNNIVMMVCAVAVFASSVRGFQDTTGHEIEQLKYRVTYLEAEKARSDALQSLRILDWSKFRACTVRTIDAINREVKAGPPPCDIEATGQ